MRSRRSRATVAVRRSSPAEYRSLSHSFLLRECRVVCERVLPASGFPLTCEPEKIGSGGALPRSPLGIGIGLRKTGRFDRGIHLGTRYDRIKRSACFFARGRDPPTNAFLSSVCAICTGVIHAPRPRRAVRNKKGSCYSILAAICRDGPVSIGKWATLYVHTLSPSVNQARMRVCGQVAGYGALRCRMKSPAVATIDLRRSASNEDATYCSTITSGPAGVSIWTFGQDRDTGSQNAQGNRSNL